jgi:hypothetical protein
MWSAGLGNGEDLDVIKLEVWPFPVRVILSKIVHSSQNVSRGRKQKRSLLLSVKDPHQIAVEKTHILVSYLRLCHQN